MIPPNPQLLRLEEVSLRRLVKAMRRVRTTLRKIAATDNPDYQLQQLVYENIFDEVLDINAALYQKGILDVRQRYSERAIRADLLTEFLKNVSLDQFYASAQRATKRMTDGFVSVLQPIMEEVMSSELIQPQRIKLLETKLASAGVTPSNPHYIETLSRTSTNAFYQEAKFESVTDPDVADIIWGYEYTTVGDNRVRPEHQYMDGKRYPKDSPIWKIWWPPNGYNCRCDVLPIFIDDPAHMRRETSPPKLEWYPPSNFQSFPGQIDV